VVAGAGRGKKKGEGEKASPVSGNLRRKEGRGKRERKKGEGGEGGVASSCLLYRATRCTGRGKGKRGGERRGRESSFVPSTTILTAYIGKEGEEGRRQGMCDFFRFHATRSGGEGRGKEKKRERRGDEEKGATVILSSVSFFIAYPAGKEKGAGGKEKERGGEGDVRRSPVST